MKLNDEMRGYLLRDADNMRSLSFSENYISEALANTHRWVNTGLLQGIADPYVIRQMARLLENQRLNNEQGTVYEIPDGTITNWVESQWKRASIPAIRRSFGAFVPFELVSVQAMSRPEDRMYYTGLDERQSSMVIQASTRSVGREWWDCEEKLDENGQHSIDREAEDLAGFCQRYTNDVTSEIIRDLKNNCGSKAQVEYADPEQLLNLVEGMSAYIAAKIKGREATWIVADPTVTAILKPFVKDWNEGENPYGEGSAGHPHYETSVKYRGSVNGKWKLYEQPLGRPGQMLLGHKDGRNHYFSGYFYCPYHPFNFQPGWYKAEGSEHQHQTLYARYAKKLLNANFYGLVELSNLPENTEERIENKTEDEGGK